MKEKNEKIKTWFDEHKGEIASEAIRIAYFAVGFGVGYFVTNKISDYQVGAGLRKLHQKGILKFVDPSTSLEITVHRAGELAAQMNK